MSESLTSEENLESSLHSLSHPHHKKYLLWVKLCPPKICMLKSYSLIPQNVTSFGGWIFTEVTNLK